MHPDQDKDIVPLGLHEPHKGITRAHQLSYKDHLRIQLIKNQEEERNRNLQRDESSRNNHRHQV